METNFLHSCPKADIVTVARATVSWVDAAGIGGYKYHNHSLDFNFLVPCTAPKPSFSPCAGIYVAFFPQMEPEAN